MRRVVVAMAGSVALANSLPAQRVVSSVDVSGTSVWYADTIRSAGSSISPALRIDWSRVTLGASADLSRLGRGGMSAQATLSPSIFSPSVGPFSGELTGSFGGSSHEDGTRTGQMLGLVRAHVMAVDRGAWIGGGAGRTWDGFVWRSVRQAEVGAWFDYGGATMLATLTPVSVEDTIRYADIQAAVRYPVRSFEFGLTVGARQGSIGPVVGGTARAWGSGSIVAWLTPRLALVANAGAYPVDLTQGYPGGRFATLAVRVASHDGRAGLRATASPSPTALSAPLAPTGHRIEPTGEERSADAAVFEVRTRSGLQRELRVRAPGARTVEINADFTQWQPVQMVRGSDGWWSVTRPLGVGTYQMNVRVDQGQWFVPHGLLKTIDEFGGSVGILAIE